MAHPLVVPECLTIHAVSALSGEPICTIQVLSETTNSDVQQRIAQEMGLGADGISLLLEGEPLGERRLYDHAQLSVVRRVGPSIALERLASPDYNLHISLGVDDSGRHRLVRGYEFLANQPSHQELQLPGFYGNHFTLRQDEWTIGDDLFRCEIERTYSSEVGFFTVEQVLESILDFEREWRPTSRGLADHHHYDGLMLNSDGASYEINWGS